MKFRQTMTLIGFGLIPAVSMAQLSGNVGYMSDYIYRGLYQEESAAMAGLDYEHDSGFYIGAWAADVDIGFETDLYFGYGGEAGDFSYSIGYTGYFYTDDFDTEYNEINLGVGWMGLSLDVAAGSWDGVVGDPLTEDDYTILELGYEYEGVYVTFGSADYDKAPSTLDWVEIGYGFEWEGLDLSIAIVNTSDGIVDELGFAAGQPLAADNALLFSISRSFSIGE